MKGGAVSGDGLVSTSRYLETFPEAVRDELLLMLQRPLTADVLAWKASEKELMERVRGND